MIKPLFFRILPLFAVLAFNSCYTSQATVNISAGEEFVLGELEDSNFRVKLKNLGKEIIEVKAVDNKSGERTQSFGLSGGGQAELYVRKSERVILANPSRIDGKVKARLSKSVSGMRYQPIKD